VDADEVVRRVLSSRPDLKEEDVWRMVEEEKRKAEGFLTDEAAALIVASRLGVEVAEPGEEVRLSIAELKPGLRGVEIRGRILSKWGPKEFTRQDGSGGMVSSLILSDGTGAIRAVFWNDLAKLVEKLSVGDVVVLDGCRVRRTTGGMEAVCEGSLRLVEEVVDIPEVQELLSKVSEVDKPGRWSVEGVVTDVKPVREFGEGRKLLRAYLHDGTAGMWAVFWDEAVDRVSEVSKGDRVRIVWGRVSRRPDGNLEIHVSKGTGVEVFPGNFWDAFRVWSPKISELKPGMRNLSMILRVVSVRAGEKVSTVVVEDGSGMAVLNLWPPMSREASKLRPGDVVVVEGCYVRRRGDRLTINLDDRGSISVREDVPEDLIPGRAPTPRVVPISTLREDMGEVTVEGVLRGLEVREVETRRGETVKVATALLEDETGSVRASFWRELADVVAEAGEGGRIRVERAYTRVFGGRVELTSGRLTRVEILQD